MARLSVASPRWAWPGLRALWVLRMLRVLRALRALRALRMLRMLRMLRALWMLRISGAARRRAWAS